MSDTSIYATAPSRQTAIREVTGVTVPLSALLGPFNYYIDGPRYGLNVTAQQVNQINARINEIYGNQQVYTEVRRGQNYVDTVLPDVNAVIQVRPGTEDQFNQVLIGAINPDASMLIDTTPDTSLSNTQAPTDKTIYSADGNIGLWLAVGAALLFGGRK